MSYTLDRPTQQHEKQFGSGPICEIPEVHWSWLFEQRAARTPDRVALVTDSGSWTFGELNEWSARLAHSLVGRGVESGSLVACLLPRSEWAVVALLAVGKARAVYLPLDTAAPENRLRAIISDARPDLIIADTDPPFETDGAVVVTPSALGGRASTDSRRSTVRTDDPTGPDLPAYIIYTSGTSGRPKGVVINSRSLVNLYQEIERNFFPAVANSPRPVRIAHGLSLSFDAAWNPLLWMCGGYELHLLPDTVRKDPELYVRAIRDRELSVVEGPATLLEEMTEHGLLDAEPYPRVVLVGGERVGQRLWSRLSGRAHTTAFNLYGPTECTVFTTWHRSGDGAEPLIGHPIANSHVRLVDDSGHPVVGDEPGELWVGGAGVADRYLNDTGLTALRFHTEIHDGEPIRWYHTGDRCRFRSDGSLEFLGRFDNQVKVRGHRVEPGEAEAALLAQPEVRNAAVTADQHRGHTRLVAYVVAVETRDGLVSTLRERLTELLPDYAVPAAFVLIDQMPTLPSGKIDLAALLTVPAGGSDTTEPRTALEQTIATIWAEVLDIANPDIHADFVDLGGHSLLAARVAARLRGRGISCFVRDVLQNPSIAALAHKLHTDAVEQASGQGRDK
ncbi:non-ribosomal peptide synthetase [Nocardia transvalensis]|uniref:non-ribosomal peptide synthetase n=1 Tax=Nocardia transvalensis TaxID=37333 RepID=UPI0018935608|nr:non-ribosomal peptide synthetase [Nocardia transvalensis]MBF6330405.1 non-ribosomal peptide synthetase [Nocardia transvalensis]